MRVLTRQLVITICTLGLLLGSLSPTLGRVTPAVAAMPSGAAYAWGYNFYGQLGNGTTTDSHTPVAVSLPSGVTATAIAGGTNHSLAIGSDGTVYAWGDNSYGQLGNGTTTNGLTPVAITLAPGVTATAIAAGYDHSLAIGSDGKVYAWGYNVYGQLGDGTNTDSHTPVAIMLASGVAATAIAGGYLHSLATGSDGKVYAWGYNANGQLGNGTTNSNVNATPVAITLASGVTATAVAAGYTHSLAIGSDGKAYAWGNNTAYGQLGTGYTANPSTPTDSYTPVAVSLPSGVAATAISAGSYHSLAIGSDGKAYAWGNNDHGQLGNGMTAAGANPYPIVVYMPGGMIPLALVAGNLHSLAIFGPPCTLAASQTGASNGQQATASVCGAGPNQPGSYTATASGSSGSVTVASYPGNPTSATAPANAHGYFDVQTSTGNNFTSVSIVDCNLGIGSGLYWFDGATWQTASPVSQNTPTTGCATLTVTSSSHPALNQLGGTPFVAGTAAPTAARVSAAHATRRAGVLTLTWRMAHARNVVGFDLYARTLRLNAHLIPVHRVASYAFHTRWSGAGPYTLHLILRNGTSISLPIH